MCNYSSDDLPKETSWAEFEMKLFSIPNLCSISFTRRFFFFEKNSNHKNKAGNCEENRPYK